MLSDQPTLHDLSEILSFSLRLTILKKSLNG
jgi:hypothetical protein